MSRNSAKAAMPMKQTRRRFLGGAALAGATAMLPARRGWAGPALETTTVRFGRLPVICFAPQYVCEELLRLEGFTDIRYVETRPQTYQQDLGNGRFDFAASVTPAHISAIDAGVPITVVAGVHAGCYELVARQEIHGIGDLKGKRVGTLAGQDLMSMMAAYVGLDPKKDLTLIDDPTVKPLELFVQGKLDAYLGIPPEPQELHARRVGHVIVRTAVDSPWSQYFCCALAGNREFVAHYPAATKRVIRAILKAADLCASEPEQVARLLVNGGFTERYDYALHALAENPYGAWREYDAEDSVRFYALRLHELGMIKSSPQKIIANGTDWRFLDEVKRELKA
jgi:NitT/TauT family transport system substrate-binding protein